MDANNEHEKWSGGNWVGECGIESLLVVHIAKQIYADIRDDNPRPYLTLEQLFSKLVGSAPPKPGRPPNILRGNKRADIVVWKNSKRPYAVIEVKRRWITDYCLKDIDRLRAIKHHCRTIEFACLAVSLQQKPKGKNLDDQYFEIENIINGHLKPEKCRSSRVDPYQTKDPNNRVYSAGGLIIEIMKYPIGEIY